MYTSRMLKDALLGPIFLCFFFNIYTFILPIKKIFKLEDSKSHCQK